MGALIAPDEEPVVTVRDASGPLVIVCEHASNRIPRALGTLGLSAADRERHIAWDPGAADVASGLAARLGGALVLQNYSRLVIDCNRAPNLPDAVTPFSEDTAIPGNTGLSPAAIAERVDAVWAPFHNGLARLLDQRRAARKPTALVTVHSFTPVYRGASRPWDVGIISTEDRRLADPVLAALRRNRALTVGDNQPYSAKDNVDYTIRRHGLERGLPQIMIEIRNDLLSVPACVAEWTARFADVLKPVAGDIGQAAEAQA